MGREREYKINRKGGGEERKRRRKAPRRCRSRPSLTGLTNLVYCSITPATSRPLSATSLWILLASLTSSSVST